MTMGKLFKNGQFVVAKHDMIGIKKGEVVKVESYASPSSVGEWLNIAGKKDRTDDGSYMESFFEPWQPKVGERVLLLEDYGRAKKGAEGIITGFWRDGISVDFNGADHSLFTRRVAPITDAAPAPAPMKIEAGKFYKTRDGRKVGPIRDGGNGLFGANRFNYKEWYGNGRCYTDLSRTHPKDLIAEWIDEPVAVAASNDNAAPAKPKFKVGDRVVAKNTHRDITEGKTYDVVEVDNHDDLMPVRVLDNAGDRYWLFRSDFEPASLAVTPAIVCLIENGHPKPAVRPFVHPDQAAAERESKRLAGIHKGKEFGVYVLTSTAKEERTYDHEWQRLAAKGEKINAIRELRDLAGLTLRCAKDAVEAWVIYQAAA